MTYDSEVLADSPWGYWKGEETSGTTLADSSTNSRNMSIPAGAPTFGATGPAAGVSALDWPSSNGATEYYAISAATQSAGAITMEAWVYLTALPATNTVVVGKALSYGNHNGNAALTVDTAGKATFWTYDGSAVRTAKAAAALSLNTWHHLVGSTGAAGTKIRVDKATAGTDLGTTTAAGADLLMIHGGTNNTDTPDLRGDNSAAIRSTRHAFYTAQLSDARADAHYDAMIPPAPASGSGSGESDASATGSLTVVAGSGSASGESTGSATATVASVPLQNRVGGRRRQAECIAAWVPAVAPAPVTVVEATRKEKAVAFGPVSFDGTQPTYDTVTAEIDRAQHRILIGGVDVTWFRDIRTPMPSYQLVEPLLYGAATVELPQVSPALERLGVGALSWLKPGKQVVIQRVVGGGVVDTDYIGVVIGFDTGGPAGQALRVQVGGEATGRAALTLRQNPIFAGKQDLGKYAYALVRDLGLLFTPHLGPATGITLARFGGMSMLDYANELTARGWTRDGNQWTIMPDAPQMLGVAGGHYRMFRKDTTTVDGTVYLDDTRCVGQLRRDIAEEPNRIFATGITPDGMRVLNGVYPGLNKGNAPRYPLNSLAPFGQGTTDAGTDTGDGVTVMINRLQVLGLLAQRDNPGGYDIDVTRAIKALQDVAGEGPTFITGDMDVDTWNALFDLDVTGYSTRWAHIEPMAESPKVRKWRRSPSGAVIGLNPRYDKSVLQVDITEDMGTGFTKDQMLEFAKSELDNSDAPNWVGTITFPLGAYITGEHTPGDTIGPGDLRSTRGLRPGMNLWAPLFDGGTLFHVSGVSVDADENVTAMVDTRARDAMKVWSIIERNRRARQSPARLWLQEHRSSTTIRDTITGWAEFGGTVEKTTLPGGQWTVLPVVAGDEGTVALLRMALSPATEFVVAVFGRRIYGSRLTRLIGNPLTKAGAKRWANSSVRAALDDRNILLYEAGDNAQPCGYFPGTKGETDENDAPYTLTGRWEDDAGFSYRTFHDDEFGLGVIFLAIYPATTTVLPAGRIMKNQLETGI